MSLKWWMKIPAKLVLSRVPIAYSVFRKYAMFKHGFMDNSAYAFGVVNHHYTIAKPWLDDDFTALELGPGDSLLSALYLSVFGASKIYLVDAGEFATKEMEPYLSAVNFLEDKGYNVDKADPTATSIEGFYKDVDMRYETNGLDSLREIPSESVDFIYSHAVLEHIREHEFDAVMAEFNRLLKPGGVCSHNIDLKDHFEESLNNLRLPKTIWESDFFAKSGFYTNRIRHNEMIERFKRSGFEITSKKNHRWDVLPVAKSKFTTPYSEYTDEDLLIYEIDTVLTKRQMRAA